METDIKTLLLQIKKNIQVIEGGDTGESLLDEVRSDFLTLIELIKLFLISERDSYYGYFLMNMRFLVDFYSNSIAGIRLGEFPPIFVSNPLLLCKHSLKEILYIVCHEIEHIIFNHPTEMIKLNPEKDEKKYRIFNYAADASVNDRLNYEIVHNKKTFLSQPIGAVTSETIQKMVPFKKVLPLENYAYYYALLDKIEDSAQQEDVCIRQNFTATSSMQNEAITNDQCNQSAENCISEDKQDLSKEDDTVVTDLNRIEEDHRWTEDEEPEDCLSEIKELVNSAVSMMNNETRGLIPASFFSQVAVFNAPPVVTWQQILKKYIGTIAVEKRSTRMRLNRRQPERFDLSGRMDDKILKIIVAIDTSGSVNDTMIGNIFNEIFDILAKRKYQITVIECDAKVQRVYTAHTAQDILTKVKGRGGTYFTPVIEYINKNRQYRDALLIYFTDGYGENEIPKPMTYRNIWVVFGDKRNLSVKNPYGIILEI